MPCLPPDTPHTAWSTDTSGYFRNNRKGTSSGCICSGFDRVCLDSRGHASLILTALHSYTGPGAGELVVRSSNPHVSWSCTSPQVPTGVEDWGGGRRKSTGSICMMMTQISVWDPDHGPGWRWRSTLGPWCGWPCQRRRRQRYHQPASVRQAC